MTATAGTSLQALEEEEASITSADTSASFKVLPFVSLVHVGDPCTGLGLLSGCGPIAFATESAVPPPPLVVSLIHFLCRRERSSLSCSEVRLGDLGSAMVPAPTVAV